MGSNDVSSLAGWTAHTLQAFRAVGWFGIALALSLILLLRLTLAKENRDLIKAPFFLLVAHVLFRVAVSAVGKDSVAYEPAYFLELLTLLLSIGRSGFVLAFDVFLGRRLGRPLPAIIRDILQGLVYAAVGIVTLRAVGVDTGSLLTTSALLTAVIGLSLQDTLGNVFAGLAIQVQHPFEVGDWIQFTDGTELVGRVVEINWRATRVLTLDGVEVTIPNGMLAKAPIRNFTKPTPLVRRSLFVQGPYEVPPARAQEAILEALRGVDGIVDQPAPSVLLRSFDDSGITYWVRYHTREFQRAEAIDGDARARIWYAFSRAQISIPFPIRTLRMGSSEDEEQRRVQAEDERDRVEALESVAIFQALSPALLEQLARSSQSRLYARGEEIIAQGTEGDELFVIKHGQVTVSFVPPHGKALDGAETELARLGPGDFFGEMSLMTGEARAASVRALEEVGLLVVDKAAFAPILDANPELAEKISALLADRHDRLVSYAENRTPSQRPDLEVRRGQLLEKIRDFFSL